MGELGNRFGHEWALDVTSPAEAIRAIIINTKGKFEEYLTGPAKDDLYQIALEKPELTLDKTEIPHRSGRCSIWIIPAIQGQDSAGAKIFAGLALIAFAVVAPMAGLSLSGSLFGIKGAVSYATLITTYGIALTLGGIAQALTPRAQSPQSADDNGSKAFQGNSTSVVQGNSVTLVYGRALVSAMPISISLDNESITTTQGGVLGEVDTIDLEGGGQQYESVDTTG